MGMNGPAPKGSRPVYSSPAPPPPRYPINREKPAKKDDSDDVGTQIVNAGITAWLLGLFR